METKKQNTRKAGVRRQNPTTPSRDTSRRPGTPAQGERRSFGSSHTDRRSAFGTTFRGEPRGGQRARRKRPAFSAAFPGEPRQGREARRGRPVFRAPGRMFIPSPTANSNRAMDEERDVLRYVPLGGLEEVGRNMCFFEYQDEIVIIDIGIQFPEEETPGIDFILPNVEYLVPRAKNIKAVVLTHGHLDHIGAVPYLIEKLGNPPIYTTDLTAEMVKRRQQEFPNAHRLDINLIKNRDVVRVGKYFELEFFGVAHTIPETMGVVVKTPVGNIVHFADFRIEYNEAGEPQGTEEYERISKLGIHSFLIDSTNSQKSGVSTSEKTVQKNLEELFSKAEGRIIVGTFSSMITRLAEMIQIAHRLGRVVAISGRSMQENLQIAQNLGYVKPPKGILISLHELHKYNDNKVMVLSTGAQGEANASLMRVISGEHRQIQIKPGDTVILSSSVIPGNERSVQNLKDNLSRQGAVVYTSGLIDIHASGHAPAEDLKLVMNIIKPKFIIPVHGYYFMRALTGKLAEEVGIPKVNVVMLDNGQVAKITPEKVVISDEQVPAYYVMVDGLGIGDVGEIVLRDRKMLAAEGMVVVIATVDKHTGRILKNPDIISRGFIYLKDNAEMLDEIRKRIRAMVGKMNPQHIDADYLKTLMRDQIGQFLFVKTHRRPMILPVVIEV